MLDLWVILPCHNEESRLDTRQITGFVESYPDAAVLLVNDASSDRTSEIIHSLAGDRPGRIHAVDRKSPKGSKAEAVRFGIDAALAIEDAAWVAYLDADLSTPFSELIRMRRIADDEPSRLLVMGARVKLYGRNIERKWYRHYLGRVFTTAASILLDLDVHDTQCGAKLLRSDLARSVFAEPFVTSWFFEIELILRSIRSAGESEARDRILEVPLHTWIHAEGSHLRVLDFFTAPIALLRIWWHYRVQKPSDSR